MGAPGADGTVTVGITDHAQQALGDLVFVEVPEAGRRASRARLRGGRVGQGRVRRLRAVAGTSPQATPALGGRARAASNSDAYGAWLVHTRRAQRSQAQLAGDAGRRRPTRAARRERLASRLTLRDQGVTHAVHSPHRQTTSARCSRHRRARASRRCSTRFPPRCACPGLPDVPPGLTRDGDRPRLMQERAARDGRRLNFIGAGAYEHHIPAAVWQIATRGEFYSAPTRRTRPRRARARCSCSTNTSP